MYFEYGEGNRMKLVLPTRASVWVAQYNVALPYVMKYENVTSTFGTWTVSIFHLFHDDILWAGATRTFQYF